MNRRILGVGVLLIVVGLLAALAIFGRKTEAQPASAPVAQAPRPVSDVHCGGTYEVDHLERFYVNGRVAVNFYFGGADRNRQPQYIWDENILGQSTEIRKMRRVDPSLAYSLVTFHCQDDPPLEGHKISNVEVMRYDLTLRRPLRPQKVIRQGGSPRQ